MDPYTDPTSDFYEGLRKWVVYSIKSVLKRPCTMSGKHPCQEKGSDMK